MKRWVFLLLLFVLAGGGTVVVFMRFDQPFLWSLLLWTVATIAGAVSAGSTRTRVVLVNFAAAMFVLTAFEAYLWLRQLNADPTRMQGDYTINYFDADELLGYGPAKDNTATSEKVFKDDVIYSVR